MPVYLTVFTCLDSVHFKIVASRQYNPSIRAIFATHNTLLTFQQDRPLV